ncbi:MAG: hypothetical protein IPJ60_18945 [Sphingobacteriaceae bacterium]|nr:hypothetical protein [Sphingobacteriaceae bacterium]
MPANCYPQQNVLTNSEKETLTLKDLLSISSIVLSDLVPLAKRGAFISNLRYNVSLIKSCIKGKIYLKTDRSTGRSVLYSYWADNAATMACMIKTFKPNVKAISELMDTRSVRI